MPAKTVLFNVKAKATHTFPLSPRNTILFSPHGRFVLVAGFGNLAGQMDIYDVEKDHEKVCTIEASNASVCEWSPDGLHILTATTSPRLRVDNGVKIWHLKGKLMYTEEMQELYHVKWRPQAAEEYPLRGSWDLEPSPHTSALSYLGSVKTPQKSAGAYRPPGARGQVTPLAFKREDEGGAAYVSNGSMSQGLNSSSFGKPRRREVPGAETISIDGSATKRVEGDDETLSKSAAKNKKKREAKKLKEAVEKTDGPALTTDASELAKAPRIGHEAHLAPPNGRSAARGLSSGQARSPRRSHNAEQSDGREKAGVNGPRGQSTDIRPDTTSPTINGVVSPHDKKIRALLKKLRAIDDLKMRRAGGEQLEGTQIKKMETEDAIKRELDDLGYKE